MFKAILEKIGEAKSSGIKSDRISKLSELSQYIQQKMDRGDAVCLNFICTHNSRRSQLAQIWAKTAAHYYALDVSTYSGGTEVTAFNYRAVEALERCGFKIEKKGTGNPRYKVAFAEEVEAIEAYSKRYDEVAAEVDQFAAVMTCDAAESNCPYIPGAEQRISLLYEDPGKFDDTPDEERMYDERCRQIASEMLYVFSQINTKA
jgi:arsenate reductase